MAMLGKAIRMGRLVNSKSDKMMAITVDHSLSRGILTGLIPITSTMQISVYTADQAMSGHVVEGGFDKFEVNGTVGISTLSATANTQSSSPNPFKNESRLHIGENGGNLTITDITGKMVETLKVQKNEQLMSLDKLI